MQIKDVVTDGSVAYWMQGGKFGSWRRVDRFVPTEIIRPDYGLPKVRGYLTKPDGEPIVHNDKRDVRSISARELHGEWDTMREIIERRDREKAERDARDEAARKANRDEIEKAIAKLAEYGIEATIMFGGSLDFDVKITRSEGSKLARLLDLIEEAPE